VIQEQLEGCKCNHELCDKILRERLHEDWPAMLQEDKGRVKDRNKEIRSNRKTCKFYEEINKMMGSKPTICPPVPSTLKQTLVWKHLILKYSRQKLEHQW